MRQLYERYHLWLHFAVIAGVAFGVYSNNYQHEYLLDSAHSLEGNSYVRSLKHIPRYFRDPKTLTAYRANADYRPVLQVTYALNYRVSGYKTWSWHLVQILLHLLVTLALYLLCRLLLRPVAKARGWSRLTRDTVPFVVAVLFVLHPTASGVVNYLHARSSLLVAALLLPSFVLYLRRPDEGTPWGAFVLFSLALFTKVEAIGALGVYLSAEVLGAARARMAGPKAVRDGGYFSDLRRALSLRTLKRLLPFVLVAGVYLIIRALVVEDYVADARHSQNVGGLVYLATQTTAWWHYVLNWIAPVGLVADYQTYPVYRSLFAPPVLLAVAGWVLVAAVLFARYRKHPHELFLAVSALALLSPTSSVLPLAEMVNEHRPYLPLALLSLVVLIPTLGSALERAQRGWRAGGALVAGLLLLVTSLFVLTYMRNRVFSTKAAYYADILKKAPSSRSHVNFGITRMKKGDLQGALRHFRRAESLSPNWHIIHINLGLAHQRLGQLRLARFHYDRAVKTEQYGGLAREYRGRFHLSQKAYGAARVDFQKSLPLCRECFGVFEGLAAAQAGRGDWQKSLHWTRRCLKLSARKAEKAIARISAPFWGHRSRYLPGYRYYLELARQLPRRWWIHQNLSDLAAKLGRSAEAAQHRQRAAVLKAGRRK